MSFKNHIAIKEWKKYVVTLIITIVIFATAIGISMWIDNARVTNIRTLQDDISLNILSSETQFNLLKDANCNDPQYRTHSLKSIRSYCRSNHSRHK